MALEISPTLQGPSSPNPLSFLVNGSLGVQERNGIDLLNIYIILPYLLIYFGLRANQNLVVLRKLTICGAGDLIGQMLGKTLNPSNSSLAPMLPHLLK